ncbi:MAG: hypothetical protein LUD83_00590 [Clostridiales bacterium]|nr:hypothetical protein [Clostridiales bacterium]
MNRQRFQAFQEAIDDRFLEEAASVAPKRTSHRFAIGMAACFCLLLTFFLFWHLGVNTEAPSDSVQVSSAEELAALGYQLTVPDDATNVTYATVDLGSDYALPMAQVSYQVEAQSYTYRALQTSQSEDISGQTETWSSDLSWKQGDIELRLCSNEEESWVGWYVAEAQTQWCLSAKTDGQALLNDAMRIAKDLGIDLATAPEEAENVTIRVLELDGLTVAETAFVYDGIQYAYRTAAAASLDLIDISGQEGDYTSEEAVMVSYCEGQLSLTADGAGKLLWMDVVPGLVFSLSAESNASADTLTALANQLFVPMQGDIG